MRPSEKYTFTLASIARLTNQSTGTVRQHLHRKKFDPTDLGSVIQYVCTIKKVITETPPHRYMELIGEEEVDLESIE